MKDSVSCPPGQMWLSGVAPGRVRFEGAHSARANLESFESVLISFRAEHQTICENPPTAIPCYVCTVDINFVHMSVCRLRRGLQMPSSDECALFLLGRAHWGV